MGVSPRLVEIATWLLIRMLLGALALILLGFAVAWCLAPLKEIADAAKSSLSDPKPAAAVVVFAVTTAFGVAAYIWKTELERATLLRELTTKLYTDPGLYAAYNELIYNYDAVTYYAVAEAIETNVKSQGDRKSVV